jgi:hypothetical protein
MPLVMETNHGFNTLFLQCPFKFLERLIVCIEWIVPDCEVIVFIDDFQIPIIPSRTVDLDLDCFSLSRYRLTMS